MPKFLFTLFLFWLACTPVHAAVFLDNNATSCTDGATDYSPSSRVCGTGSDTVYTTLQGFESGLVAGEINYVRAGDYFRDNANGTLRIPSSKSGSSNESRTVIAAYTGEERQAVFATQTRGKTYNSDPSDITGVGSRDYYPNTVIAISGASYVTIDGIKTYGQVYSWGGHDVTFQNSDFGGGGPSEDQGSVVKFHSGYNLLLKNSIVHHSCWGENVQNGASVIMYDASAQFDKVTFYDDYGPSIHVKDTGGQDGRVVDIAYSHFMKSSINTAGTVGGVLGHNQDEDIDNVIIRHNVFQHAGYAVLSSLKSIIYNNTFINCKYVIGDSSGGGPHPYTVHNNVMYTNSSSELFVLLYDPSWITSLSIDNNVYYGPGVWKKSAPGDETVLGSSLPAWQTFSSLDTNSISADPQFVNATGTTPSDFKRVAYAENFTTSAYGTKAGAYVTGDEQIGADWLYGADPEDPTDPEDPDPTTTSGPILRTGSHLLRVGDSVLRVQ